MANSRVESELIKRLTELRKDIRNKAASVDECLEFMKVCDSASDGESFNMPDSLNVLTSLRNELPLENAVTFLKNYLNSLDKTFSNNNWLYVIEIGFLIADDLVEMSNMSDAEEEYKQILEWLTERDFPPGVALATSKLSMLAWHRGSKREAKHYYRKCFEMLQRIMDQRKESSFTMPDYQMQFAMEAFVECGRFMRFVMKKYDSAEKFFLKALEYIPKDDDIFSKCMIHSQIDQNERSSKNFGGKTRLPQLNLRNVSSSNKTLEFSKLCIENGNFTPKNMKEFLRNLVVNDFCETISSPDIFTEIEVECYASDTLNRSRILLETNETDEKTAHHLALLSFIMFQKGNSDYRKFKEQSKKFINACMAKLEIKPVYEVYYKHVQYLMRAIVLMFELCLEEKCYNEAEEHADKASMVAYNYPLGPLDAQLKGEMYFLLACLNYYRRGRVSAVNSYCNLALNHYEMACKMYFEWPQFLEKRVIECLLKSLVLK